MKTKIIICSLLLISLIFLSIPFVTLAAWWNPFSWFRLAEANNSKVVRIDSLLNLWNPISWIKSKISNPEVETKSNENSAQEQSDNGQSEKQNLGIITEDKKVDPPQYLIESEQTNTGDTKVKVEEEFSESKIQNKGNTGAEQEELQNKQDQLSPAGNILCNGKYWAPCPSGQRFFCPATGDLQCLEENVQTVQQIQENNTLPVCMPNWQCKAWNTCENSIQTRVCIDLNGCGVSTGKPTESHFCIVPCIPDWQCDTWNTCVNSQQTRICTDLNNCKIITGKPSENQPCVSLPVLPTPEQQAQSCQDAYDQSISSLGDGGVQDATNYYNSIVSQTPSSEYWASRGLTFSSQREKAQQLLNDAKAQLDSTKLQYKANLGAVEDSLQTCLNAIIQNP